MVNSKVLRDKRSGRFLGSVGVGKYKVPAPVPVPGVDEWLNKVDKVAREGDIERTIIEQRFDEFVVHYPWYKDTGVIGHGASTIHRVAETRDFGNDPRSIFVKILERAQIVQYKAVSKASGRRLDSFINRSRSKKPGITFGLLANPNLSEDHLMTLATRVPEHKWMDVYIQHPAAGEKFLGTIASSRFEDNSDQREDVAKLPKIPLSVQHMLLEDDDDDVREALTKNPTVSDEVKVAATLIPNNDIFHLNTNSYHPYVFPLPERFKSRLPKAKRE